MTESELETLTEIKCPQPECTYQIEPYYMKIHLENELGITQHLEIRESVGNEKPRK